MSLEPTTNCGIYEFDGVRVFDGCSPREFMLMFDEECQDALINKTWRYPAMITFSDARGYRSRRFTAGDRFAAYIMDNHLGELTWSTWKRNPNTGNSIKMWVWYPNPRRINALILRCRREQDRIDNQPYSTSNQG